MKVCNRKDRSLCRLYYHVRKAFDKNRQLPERTQTLALIRSFEVFPFLAFSYIFIRQENPLSHANVAQI